MPELPPWYERLIALCTGIDIARPRDLDRVAGNVALLSELFNSPKPRGSGGFEPYLRDSETRNAYFLYYTTSNLLKLAAPLDELRLAESFPDRRSGSMSVLDVGCGTGTSLLGVLSWLESRAIPVTTLDVHAIDSAPQAVSFVQALAGSLRQLIPALPLAFDASVANLRHAGGLGRRFDLILLSNVLGEMPDLDRASLSDFLSDHLAQDGAVVMIEPALQETSRRLESLRDAFIASGWTVYSPCFRQGNCPALDDERDWCHHDLPWKRPPFIRAIDDNVGNLKLSLKFSYLVLNRHGETLAGRTGRSEPVFRVVSERFDEKGRTRAFLCGENGRIPFMLNTRDATEANAAFQSAVRYDVLTVDGFETRKHDAKIHAGTRVEKIAAEQISKSAVSGL
jgi:SAM-dependent methyltransferase